MYVLHGIFSTWTRVALPLPPEAFASDTQFRWRGQENCQNCQYAIDDCKYSIMYLKFLYNSGLILQCILVQDVLPTAMAKEYALMKNAGLHPLIYSDTKFGLLHQRVGKIAHFNDCS